MTVFDTLQAWVGHLGFPSLVVVGMITLAGMYMGKTMKYLRLPSIIGFMLVGVLLGPSLAGLLAGEIQERLCFITEMALGFVAVSIGLELSFAALKQQGPAIILIIFSESLLAFVLVTLGIFFLTRDLSLALLFGSIAPASAPAGTVAVIQEYKARGSLTKALYAVVGFDDGLGIIIFGFASAVARGLLAAEAGGGEAAILARLAAPLVEIGLSMLVGALAALLFCLLARRLTSSRDIFILIFAVVLIATGISAWLHLSYILTNMVMGIVIVNTQRHALIQMMRDELTEFMPLLFILFFVLAGANLQVAALPALGLLGLVYVFCRSAGLMGGAWFGAAAGRAEKKIRRYLGMGILSQAGVAIGLALIVKQEFSSLGPRGAYIGATVITSITATSILFELIGPILTKIGLEKAGEIGATS
jgi:Kef-type K+ transport system membrane component KefB